MSQKRKLQNNSFTIRKRSRRNFSDSAKRKLPQEYYKTNKKQKLPKRIPPHCVDMNDLKIIIAKFDALSSKMTEIQQENAILRSIIENHVCSPKTPNDFRYNKYVF